MNPQPIIQPETAAKPMLRRELHPKATVPEDLSGPVIDFRSSDQTLDRYQEVITVAGWKLENYRKNPIVQNAHSYCSLSDTIGKSLITEIRTISGSAPYLFQRVLFAVEENPMAKVAYGLYKGGFLNAVSVGFIPLRWDNGGEEAAYQRKYLEQELLEVSAVSLPANPNAITMALKAGAIEKSDFKELYNLLKHLCTEASTVVGRLPSTGAPPSTQISINQQQNQADRTSYTGALGPAIFEAQLLQLTKQLHEIRTLLKRA